MLKIQETLGIEAIGSRVDVLRMRDVVTSLIQISQSIHLTHHQFIP